ncbi:MAG: pyridoxine 5'-phosphate synthase [Bacteroidales bacterium]|nr:pyridoxine 5'-phosphate synthase [Bacteroidales bacterium]
MTRLSVNINKIATLRNARGGDIPDVLLAAVRCQEFGAQGITVHPRPDERHITRKDVFELKPLIKTEFNIEGYPGRDFLKLVLEILPDQVTLVPDAPDAITSNQGWDSIKYKSFLTDVIGELKSAGIRTSVFMGTDLQLIRAIKETGTDRIELYTEPYASRYPADRNDAIQPFIAAAELAVELGLGLNAGHDLNLDNLRFFNENIPGLLEVSIGHALVADSLYFGLENTIHRYLDQIK